MVGRLLVSVVSLPRTISKFADKVLRYKVGSIKVALVIITTTFRGFHSVLLSRARHHQKLNSKVIQILLSNADHLLSLYLRESTTCLKQVV